MAVRNKQQPVAPRPKPTPKQAAPASEAESEAKRLNEAFAAWLEEHDAQPDLVILTPLGAPLQVQHFIPQGMVVQVVIRPRGEAE